MACSGTALLLLSHERFSRAIVAALFGCLFLVLCNMNGFDAEKFISEIESRPEIWNTQSREYANNNEKAKAWE